MNSHLTVARFGTAVVSMCAGYAAAGPISSFTRTFDFTESQSRGFYSHTQGTSLAGYEIPDAPVNGFFTVDYSVTVSFDADAGTMSASMQGNAYYDMDGIAYNFTRFGTSGGTVFMDGGFFAAETDPTSTQTVTNPDFIGADSVRAVFGFNDPIVYTLGAHTREHVNQGAGSGTFSIDEITQIAGPSGGGGVPFYTLPGFPGGNLGVQALEVDLDVLTGEIEIQGWLGGAGDNTRIDAGLGNLFTLAVYFEDTFVVPAPGAVAPFALAGLVAVRRRR